MNYEPYKLNVNEECTRFQFQSVGKWGISEKVISFKPFSEKVYNLALLDYDPNTGKESDISVTDNGDLYEILATAMMVINLFLEKYPTEYIYFVGSIKSRTRLYQISINKVYPNIKNNFIIFGLHNHEWRNFEPGLQCESFLIGKKILT